MVFFESVSRVSSLHLPLICLGDQAFFILERIYFSNSPHGSIRQYLLEARDLRITLLRCTEWGRSCGFLFPTSLKFSTLDIPFLRMEYSFSLLPLLPPVYWNFLSLYSIPLFWNKRYKVLLLRESFVAISGIEYPSTSNTRISWSSPRDIWCFHVIIPQSIYVNWTLQLL